jgi:hypothetical protein
MKRTLAAALAATSLAAARNGDARGGRPVGRYMVCALRKHAGAPAQAAQRCYDWVAETGQPAPR